MTAETSFSGDTHVIASEAKRSNPDRLRSNDLDCFVASLLAMTAYLIRGNSTRTQGDRHRRIGKRFANLGLLLARD
jgi:hypothetical protein